MDQPETGYSELRWRWQWLKARVRGMPLGYREWRSRVDGWLVLESDMYDAVTKMNETHALLVSVFKGHQLEEEHR